MCALGVHPKRPQTKTATDYIIQSETKTATFSQQVKSHLVIKFLQLEQKCRPAEYVNKFITVFMRLAILSFYKLLFFTSHGHVFIMLLRQATRWFARDFLAGRTSFRFWICCLVPEIFAIKV